MISTLFNTFFGLFKDAFKHRPGLKIIILFTLAAYASRSMNISQFDAYSVDWGLSLFTGMVIAGFYFGAPIAFISTFFSGLARGVATSSKAPDVLAEASLWAYKLFLIISGQSSWLVTTCIPGIIVAGCSNYILDNAYQVESLIEFSLGPEYTLFWAMRAVVLVYVFLMYIAPERSKEEPRVLTSIPKPASYKERKIG